MSTENLRPGYFDSEGGKSYLVAYPPQPMQPKKKKTHHPQQQQQQPPAKKDFNNPTHALRLHQAEEIRDQMQPSNNININHTSNNNSSPDENEGNGLSLQQRRNMVTQSKRQQQQQQQYADEGEGDLKNNTSQLHLKMRPALYDVRNRPRAQAVQAPSVKHGSSVPQPNAKNTELEVPVKRKTTTSSVLQKELLMSSKAAADSILLGREVDVPLPNQFRCHPAVVSFGYVRADTIVTCRIILSNISNDTARYRIKQPRTLDIRVHYTPGPVAAGMMSHLQVQLNAKTIREIKDSFDVVSEYEVFTIPVSANVMSIEDYEDMEMSGGPLPTSTKFKVQQNTEVSITTNKSSKNKDVSSSSASNNNDDAITVPSAIADWVVDPSKSVKEISSMSLENRMKLRAYQQNPGLFAGPPDLSAQEDDPHEPSDADLDAQ